MKKTTSSLFAATAALGLIAASAGVAFAAERGHMCRNGQSQYIIGRRTLLRRCTKPRQEKEEEN